MRDRWLLACFRGHKPDVLTHQLTESKDSARFLVACVQCGAVTKQHADRDTAIAEWNDHDAKFWQTTTTQPPMPNTWSTRYTRWAHRRKV